MTDRILSVSVDLDSPACYHAIHGLPPPDSHPDSHYTDGLCRFLALFEEMGVKATLFAVGRDLERPACISVIRDASRAGHEVGNHTWSHDYSFAHLEEERIREEIAGGEERITEAVGTRPVGFRAPGYYVSDLVHELLRARAYGYDASILPSPPYFLLKASVMALMRLRGRRSGSVVGHPGLALSPNHPYRLGRPYWIPGRGLPELPCTTVPGLRIPFIGTTLALAGVKVSAAAARLAASKRFVGLEFHPIDLMEPRDGLAALEPYRPDLRVPLDRRRETFRTVLRTLLDAGHDPITLAAARERLFPD